MSLQFEEVSENSQCPVYFASLAAFTDLKAVCQLTKNFRTQFPSYAHGFVIDIGTIRDLLSQNSGNVTGIKMYMGLDRLGTFKAVAVATINSSYDDFGIPDIATGPCNVILGEARPCPSECGKANPLNTD